MNEIINPEEWVFNNNGKSPAYFSLKSHASVSREMIDYIKKLSESKGRINMRFCLNSSPDEELQDMIILEYKDKKCRIPHKHLDGNEAIHLIEGKLLALILDDDGKLLDKRILSEDGEFAYRNAQNRQHLYFPLTDHIIFREIRGGKFERKNLVSPNWNFLEVFKEYLNPNELGCYNSECKSICNLFNHS
ncbi:MAG: WbuC family cupin fold metalloprotein [Nanoarchaeota archaeon]|nr:WbuC family cupin fold metalloprotein [Nanoarchaeota archaeon]